MFSRLCPADILQSGYDNVDCATAKAAKLKLYAICAAGKVCCV